MNSNMSANRFVCPMLAVLATVVALFGTWFTRTMRTTGTTSTASLLEVIRGEAFIEYTTARWLWISGIGVLLVIASAVVGLQLRGRLAQAGSILMLMLPGWSLLYVYTGDDRVSAGSALWASAAISVLVVILARMIPQETSAPDPQSGPAL